MRCRDRPHRLQHLWRTADIDVWLLAFLVKQLGEGIGCGADKTFPGALRMPDTYDDLQFRESDLQFLARRQKLWVIRTECIALHCVVGVGW
jgi:hypothetical protein